MINYYLKWIIKSSLGILFLLLLYVNISGCKKRTFRVKNQVILQQVDTFINDALRYSNMLEDRNTPVVVYIDKGKRNYPYSFNFKFIKPHTCKNLIGYIDRNNRTIYFFVDSNVTAINYFENTNVCKCDTSMLRKVIRLETTEWYNDLLYFDGNKFKRWNEI